MNRNFSFYEYDPARVSPDIYHVLLENDAVRVLEMRMLPGKKDSMHIHPECIVIALSDAHIKVFSYDTVVQEEMKAGSIVRQASVGPHYTQNIGDEPMHAIIIEVRPSFVQLTRWHIS